MPGPSIPPHRYKKRGKRKSPIAAPQPGGGLPKPKPRRRGGEGVGKAITRTGRKYGVTRKRKNLYAGRGPGAPSKGTQRQARSLGRAVGKQGGKAYRKQTREGYARKPLKERKRIQGKLKGKDRGERTLSERELRRFSEERIRAEGVLRTFMRVAGKKEPLTVDNLDEVLRGQRMAKNLERKQRERLRKAMLADVLKGGGAVASARLQKQEKGIEQSAIGIPLQFFSSLATTGAPDKAVTKTVQERVRSSVGAMSDSERKRIRSRTDATVKLLENLNRGASASAGATIAATEGKDPLKGAFEGFVKNDKSYKTVAEKAGLKGTAATVAGLLGDIFLDPTTYIALGSTTPGKAAGTAAAKKATRLSPKAQKALKKLAKAAERGDDDAMRALKSAARHQRKVAARARKAVEQGGKYTADAKGIQVGFVVPAPIRAAAGVGRRLGVGHGVPRVVQTKGRWTAAVGKHTGMSRVGREAQQRVVAGGKSGQRFPATPRQRPLGADDAINPKTGKPLTPSDFEESHHVMRQSRALDRYFTERFMSLSRRLKKLQEKQPGDLEKVLRAVEADDMARLSDDLRPIADDMAKLYDEYAEAYYKVTGRRLRLSDQVLSPKQLANAKKAFRKTLKTMYKRAARDARRAGDAAEAAGVERVAGARRAFGEAHGRAAVGSRTVGDEYAAHRLVRAIDKVERMEGKRGKPADILRLIDEVDRPPLPAGGKGLEEAAAGLGDELDALRLAQETRADRLKRLREDADNILETLASSPGRSYADELDATRRLRGILDQLADDRHAKAIDDYLGGVRSGRIRGAADDLQEQARVKNLRLALENDSEAWARRVIKKAREDTPGATISPGVPKAERDLSRVLSRLEKKVQYAPPKRYVPRKPWKYLKDWVDDAGDRPPWEQLQRAAGGVDDQRVIRQALENMDEDTAKLYGKRMVPEGGPDADWFPLVNATYGASGARHLKVAQLHQDALRRFAAPATWDNVDYGTLVKIGDDGTWSPVVRGSKEEAKLIKAKYSAKAVGDEFVVLPDPIVRTLSPDALKYATEDSGKFFRWYDAALRGWKAAQTVLRPGFYMTTFLGNNWQLFLADASLDDFARTAQAFRMARRSRKAFRHGSSDEGMLGGVLDRLFPGTFAKVDNVPMPLSEVWNLARQYGAIRTGSRVIEMGEYGPDVLVQHAVGARGGAVTKRVKGGAGRVLDATGNLSEDMDDMTRLILFRRGLNQGMTPAEATEYTYRFMIDYGDLSQWERKAARRLMPFYVYTSRNIPIQLRRLLARPGKFANFDKVRQALAAEAGLPEDWEAILAEADQERLPVPVPIKKLFNSAGLPLFVGLRLPAEDISRPAQLFEGGRGVQRFGERMVGDVVPFLKYPIEAGFNKRFDYDRPIDLPGRPPAIGLLGRAVAQLGEGAGVNLGVRRGEYTDERLGETTKFEGMSPWWDSALRQFGGGWGSALSTVGKSIPNRWSNVNPNVAALASLFGGVTLTQPRSWAVGTENRLYEDVDRAYDRFKDYQKRAGEGYGQFGVKTYRAERSLDELRAVLAMVKALRGDRVAEQRVADWEAKKRTPRYVLGRDPGGQRLLLQLRKMDADRRNAQRRIYGK